MKDDTLYFKKEIRPIHSLIFHQSFITDKKFAHTFIFTQTTYCCFQEKEQHLFIIL